ncbi:MAG: multiple sugar transport system permease protein [Candidatus Atribacteria bacterium]|jgi:multiple sugar transport system permease protein|nr:multiple sugar transport system permease protein [Candidatus Atribacteria bacterium]MDI3530801.1 multiple sugar transport system permease protein [Candidatus Atribacteria bacterium]
MALKKLEGETMGWQILVHVVLTVGAILMFGPFLPVISASLKSYSELMLRPFAIIPKKFLWGNYLKVFQEVPFLLYIWNTVKVSFLCTVGVLASSSMAAYAFARLRFPGRNLLFLIYLATMMVPGQVTLVPVFILMRNFGLIDTHASLILPMWGLTAAYGTFLLRQFFLTIPRDLEEAAILDGCGYFGRFTRIILPLSKPALATLGIFTLLSMWNNYLYPLVFLNSPEKRTLTLGLAMFRGDVDVQWNLLMAGTILSICPMVIAFLAAQRYFVEGITLTGLKG